MMSRKNAIKGLISNVAIGLAVSQAAYGAATIWDGTSTIKINGSDVVVKKLTSDGVPYYGSGGSAAFPPGVSYTHTPSAKSYTYYIPVTPALAGTSAAPKYTPVGLSNDFGVALDGVPFDPLTSYCGTDSARSTVNTCSYRVEARLQTDPKTKTSAYTAKRLGFDVHNGHSQSDGAYHYHGITCGIVTTSGGSSAFTCDPTSTADATPFAHISKTTIVGFARDGYPIIVQGGIFASYAVVTAAGSGRPTVTGYTSLGNFSMDMSRLVSSGTTFTMPTSKTFADFTYTGPSGYGTSTSALGLCNEAANTNPAITLLDGKTMAAYAYYLTPNFPMIPRCLIGVADGSTGSPTNNQGFYHTVVAFDGAE
ncbi:MAG: YHYH protein [Sulfuricella sp.]|nr:YHYH protein [Sulfuricella sp.]